MLFKNISYKPFGERAVLIAWEAKISEEILQDIYLYKHKIQGGYKELIEDCIIGYHSLTIVFKQPINFETITTTLQKNYLEKKEIEKEPNYLWKIPVCYDTQFGIDLKVISSKLNLPIEKVIQLHCQAIYTVYFIGFLPGFLYLGGLHKKLHFPRKPTPRLQVAKGAVAIGGAQTGVYPKESAGGWNIIGNTPVSFFNLTKKHPCFAKPGDKIQFFAIDLEEYNSFEKEQYNPEKVLLK